MYNTTIIARCLRVGGGGGEEVHAQMVVNHIMQNNILGIFQHDNVRLHTMRMNPIEHEWD